MLPAEPAERWRHTAGRFTGVAAGVLRWDSPTPVPAWTARDVVGHLVEWLPPLLAAGAGVELDAGPPVEDDPAAAWRHHATAVQAVLDDPALADAHFEHPPLPATTVAQAIDQLYTSDAFMHTWDLARASGQADELDAEECERLLAGMVPMEQLLRSSGHYGPPMPVAADAPATLRMMAFIGRDPAWTAPDPVG